MQQCIYLSLLFKILITKLYQLQVANKIFNLLLIRKQQQKKHIKHMERRHSETQDMATSEISHFSDNHPTTPEQSQTEAEDLMSIEMEDISMKLDSRNDVVDEPCMYVLLRLFVLGVI